MTGSVVPPTTISDEIERVVQSVALHVPWGFSWERREALVREVLSVAVPYIEAGLREKLATEIEAQQYGRGLVGMFAQAAKDFNAGIRSAARVARGTQEATR